MNRLRKPTILDQAPECWPRDPGVCADRAPPPNSFVGAGRASSQRMPAVGTGTCGRRRDVRTDVDRSREGHDSSCEGLAVREFLLGEIAALPLGSRLDPLDSDRELTLVRREG